MTNERTSQDAGGRRRIFGAVVFAAVLHMVFFTFESGGDAGFWVSMVLFPICVGMTLQIILDPMVRQPFGWVSRWVWGILALLAVAMLVVAAETLICVVIGSPFLLGLPLVGISLTRIALMRLNDRSAQITRVSLLGLPLVMASLGWSFLFPERTEMVTNQIVIDAPAEVVWQHIMTFDTVQPEEQLRTVSHNLLQATQPIRSSVQDSIRYAEWTMGVDYEEYLTLVSAPTTMLWDIRFAPDFKRDGFDTHISPASSQLMLLRGGYDLEEVRGKTTVTLTTEYRLRTAFNGYVAWWGAQFLGDNHNSILHVLKRRAEDET